MEPGLRTYILKRVAFAVLMLVGLPSAILYILFLDHFIRGLTATGTN